MTTASPGAVRRKIEGWLAEESPAGTERSRVLALRAQPAWADDPVLVVAGSPVRIVPCATPLAVRAALREHTGPDRLVLLTELTDLQLGEGIRAHLSQHTVRSIDPWDLVRQLFDGAAALDPGLVRAGRWAADALTEYAPQGHWPAPAGAVLTREHALRCLAGELLGLQRDQIDSAGLLQWTTRPHDLLRFTALPDSHVKGLTDFLVEIAGAAAAPLMAAVRTGHGADAVPLGLLAEVLWPERSDASDIDLAVARVRLEQRLGRPSEVEARAFHRAAEAWVDRAGDAGDNTEARRMLRRAEMIAAESDMTHLLAGSSVLPVGFTQRIHAFAAILRDVLASPGGPTVEAVVRAQDALASAVEHRYGDTAQVGTARMAVRLLRWLVNQEDPAPVTLADALHRQVRQDAWVDRARLDIFAGGTDTVLREAYGKLHRAVDARRRRHDEQFATLLAAATADNAPPGSLLQVEDVLDRVVQPVLDHGRRVLLLILDGMSTAGATELAESLTRAGSAWMELTHDGGDRTGILAALPTITSVSRCSLLSGAISTGKQPEERRAFTTRYPSGALLYKADLRGAAGSALAPDVVDALADPDRPMVAAVINTVDDALHNTDPGTIVWGTDTIVAVRDLLALSADRVVIIVSDHGHVVDRGAEADRLPAEGGGQRWRPPATPPVEGELLLTGERVALGSGGVVLPWREELRYGIREAGYHGGAAPAEAVIPLLVFSASDETAVPGWASAPVASPRWWREPLTASSPRIPVALPSTPRRGRQSPPSSEALFEVPAAPAVPPPSRTVEVDRSSLVDALLASPIYRQRRGARAQLPDDRVAALMGVLLAGGGRATYETLAAGAGVPAHRIAGTITVLRKILQVEGYAVLDLDADRQTVLLNEPLLIEQFGLDRP